MDVVLAILVLGTAIFFGALISAGNERQRKALEGIREQTAQWAIQDLRLKREKLAREVKVDDPVAWLNLVVAKAYGENLGLTATEFIENPHTLVCTAKDGRAVLLSTASPEDIHKTNMKRQGRLSRVPNFHPLLKLPRNVECTKLSILNAGVLFDLELQQMWKLVSGQDELKADILWMYI